MARLVATYDGTGCPSCLSSYTFEVWDGSGPWEPQVLCAGCGVTFHPVYGTLIPDPED